ncbi:flagellar basal body rod protein FlgB [Cohnella soli]|uniref:Flagellar basal body rod protein FlgB n=1 Tax=Cohnella soli TaxID=425005 RepID=A0ABW0HNZ3_9BACL
MEVLSGASFHRLESAINAATMRQQVLTNNIANVNTPYFKRSDVAFEEYLAQAIGSDGNKTLAIKVTNSRHFPMNASNPAPEVVTDSSTTFNNDRNNVDIEKEMSMLAENQLRYNLLSQQVSHEAKMMRIGIVGSA